MDKGTKPELMVTVLTCQVISSRSQPPAGADGKPLPRELKGRRPKHGKPRSGVGQAGQQNGKEEERVGRKCHPESLQSVLTIIRYMSINIYIYKSIKIDVAEEYETVYSKARGAGVSNRIRGKKERKGRKKKEKKKPEKEKGRRPRCYP